MPYKNIEDYRANKRFKRHVIRPRQREYERMVAIDRFRAMGLEPVDLNDPHSSLICDTCGKETGRSSPLARHEEDCFYFTVKYPKNRVPAKVK